MSVSVFVDGAAGTTGLEIGERLAGRADIALITLPEERRKDPQARTDALKSADVAILCLHDDAAREAVALIGDAPTRVIDASTAHRTDPAWTYGFPELDVGQREAIATAQRVSNPGCYPTGFLALVRPLVSAGIVPAYLPLSVNAVSGYSGGGKSLIARFEDQAAAGATATGLRLYGLGLGHKHVPEMQTHGGLELPPIFLPAVARTYRGMTVEVPLHLMTLNGGIDDIREALHDAYADSDVVRVIDETPDELLIERCAGSDRLEIFVYSEPKTGQVRLVALLDNLGKGAAGAAVQNLNLMAGLKETAGLRL
ncbi:MAG: N-acetyl-gamma-glutamyl-phosphate reductase [Sphingomonadaceae bacterium]|nr:N-acetyl-gamma-glutamyl-phosphate reductase [Sphingomonadaceae bacterium]